MGLVPYIKTGTECSAELMNDLYEELDETVNLVTNGKSMFFLNVVGTPGGTAGDWPFGMTPENYYGYLANMVEGGFMVDPNIWPNFTFGQDSSADRPGGTIKMSERQFWFLSGVKSGDCDPEDLDNDNREHCVGLEWKTPRRVDVDEDIGWYWKLYGRHYTFMAELAWGSRYHPPLYKHEYHEKMLDDVRIFQYNTGKKTVAVLEVGTKTSDYGRFPNEWTNPFISVEERQRIPYIGAGWSLGHEFDNSLQVHKIKGIKSLIGYHMFLPTEIGDIVAGLEPTDPHPVGLDPSGPSGITGPSGPSNNVSSIQHSSEPYEAQKYLAKSSYWSGLIKIAEEPDRTKYTHEKENHITEEDRTDFYKTCDTHGHHVLCTKTSKDELKNIMEGWNKQNPHRTGIAGYCADPYSCWMAASKYWFWTELKEAVGRLYTHGDQTLTFTYSFVRPNTPIQAASPYPTVPHLSTTALAADWNGTSDGTEHDKSEGWQAPGEWNNTTGLASPHNLSGQSTTFTEVQSAVASAFEQWKDLIETKYQNFGESCGLPGSDLTINFENLGLEGAGGVSYGLNDSLGVDEAGDPLLELPTLNIGRMRFASAKTGDWLNGTANVFDPGGTIFAYSNFPHIEDPWTIAETNLAQDGNIVINPNHNWKSDASINTGTWGLTGAGDTNPHLEVSIAKVVAHELGHSLGFGHSSSNKCDSIMTPSIMFGETIESDFPNGLNPDTDGKCLEEMYGESDGPVCFEGYSLTSFDLNYHDAPENLDEFVRWPWYAATNTIPDPGDALAYPHIPPYVVVENWPQIENRFEVAELIFDGYETCDSCGLDHDGEGSFEGYKDYTLSNKYDKYKFFRIHNLNNYDMTLKFEAQEVNGTSFEEATKVATSIWTQGEETTVFGECDPGIGHTIEIPKHESRCLRRDFGEYTEGFNHFQKFVKGDHRYSIELSENFKMYPRYYDHIGRDWSWFRYNHTNNVVNPFLIDRIITGLGDRLIFDEGAWGRTWDSDSVYGSQLATDAEMTGRKTHDSFDPGKTGAGIQDPAGSMTVPTYISNYRDDDYDWETWNKDTLLADFIYHTGFVAQNFLMTSGSAHPALLQQSPEFGPTIDAVQVSRYCLHKKFVPYKGAKYIYRFLQDLNVNLISINPAAHQGWGGNAGKAQAKVDEANAFWEGGEGSRTISRTWDYGVSGMFVGHTGFASPFNAEQERDGSNADGPNPASFADVEQLSNYFDTVDKLLSTERYSKGGGWPDMEAAKPAEDGFQWALGPFKKGTDEIAFKPHALDDPDSSRDRRAVQWPTNDNLADDIGDVETGTCCDDLSVGIRDEWVSEDNIWNDPFAYSIHQYNMTTNILGTNHHQAAIGQLYPMFWESTSRCIVKVCASAVGGGADSHQRFYSNIDFINHQDHKFGNVWYGKKPITGYVQSGGFYSVGAKTPAEPSNLFAAIYSYYEAGQRGQNNYKYYHMGYSRTETPANVFPHRQANVECQADKSPGGRYGFSGAGQSLDTVHTGNRLLSDEIRIWSFPETGPVDCSECGGAERWFLDYHGSEAGKNFVANRHTEHHNPDSARGPSRAFFYYTNPKSYLALRQKDGTMAGGNRERVYLECDFNDFYDPDHFKSFKDVDNDGNTCWNCGNLMEADWPYLRQETHHIPDIVRGNVLDSRLASPTVDIVTERWFPFHYRHDHANHIAAVGSETAYGIWGQDNRDLRSGPVDLERFGSKKLGGPKNSHAAENIWEGRRNFFETKLGDVDKALYEFNRVDGIWTGFQRATGGHPGATHQDPTVYPASSHEMERLNYYTLETGSMGGVAGEFAYRAQYLPEFWPKRPHEISYLTDVEHRAVHGHIFSYAYFWNKLYSGQISLDYVPGHDGGFNVFTPSGHHLVENFGHPQEYEFVQRVSPPVYNSKVLEKFDLDTLGGEEGEAEDEAERLAAYDLTALSSEKADKFGGTSIKSEVGKMFDNAREGVSNSEYFNFNNSPNARYFFGDYGKFNYTYQKNINLIYKTAPELNKGALFAWRNPEHVHMQASKDYDRNNSDHAFYPEPLFLSSDAYGRHNYSPVLHTRRIDKLTTQKNVSQDGVHPEVGLDAMGGAISHPQAFTTRDGRQHDPYFAGCLVPPCWNSVDGRYRYDTSLGIVNHNYNSYFQLTTRAGEKTSRRAAAMGSNSNFFRGTSRVGANLTVGPGATPNSQELFHYSGLWYLHPELYSNPLRRGNVHARASGKYGVGEFTTDVYTKKRIGYHKEYGAIDVPYRSDGEVTVLAGVTCGPGPSLVELDKHYSTFGPPAEVHVPTGQPDVTLGGGSTLQTGLYWPACNWIFPEVLGSAARSSFTKYCPHVIFRKKTDANCGNPDPRTALDALGADEWIPSGVPIIGCSTCYVAGGRAGTVASTACCDDVGPYGDPILSKIWGNTDNDYKVVGIQLTGAIKSDGTFVSKDDLDSLGGNIGKTLLDGIHVEIHPPATWPNTIDDFPNIPASSLVCEPWTGWAAARTPVADPAHPNGDAIQYAWWHGPFPYFDNKNFEIDPGALTCDFSACPGEECPYPDLFLDGPGFGFDKEFDQDEISGHGALGVMYGEINHYTGVMCHHGAGYKVQNPGAFSDFEYYMNDKPLQQYVYWGMSWGCGDSTAWEDTSDTDMAGLGPGGIANQEIDDNLGTHYPPYNTRNPAFYEYEEASNTGEC